MSSSSVADPFAGSWEVDLESGVSRVWNESTSRFVADPVGREEVTIEVAAGVQTYAVRYGKSPTVRLGYCSRYDDPEWVPYTVLAIEGELAVAEATQDYLGPDLRVGAAIGMVRTIWVDPSTHYRLSRDPTTGAAQYAMQRRLAPDRESYLATVLDAAGHISIIRRFVRHRQTV